MVGVTLGTFSIPVTSALQKLPFKAARLSLLKRSHWHNLCCNGQRLTHPGDNLACMHHPPACLWTTLAATAHLQQPDVDISDVSIELRMLLLRVLLLLQRVCHC